MHPRLHPGAPRSTAEKAFFCRAERLNTSQKHASNAAPLKAKTESTTRFARPFPSAQIDFQVPAPTWKRDASAAESRETRSGGSRHRTASGHARSLRRPGSRRRRRTAPESRPPPPLTLLHVAVGAAGHGHAELPLGLGQTAAAEGVQAGQQFGLSLAPALQALRAHGAGVQQRERARRRRRQRGNRAGARPRNHPGPRLGLGLPETTLRRRRRRRARALPLLERRCGGRGRRRTRGGRGRGLQAAAAARPGLGSPLPAAAASFVFRHVSSFEPNSPLRARTASQRAVRAPQREGGSGARAGVAARCEAVRGQTRRDVT